VPALEDRIRDRLRDTYALERELGGGGMSRVYVAVDRRLERRVAIKVLLPELAAGVSADRFRREILLAASLQHPHVVPVLAAGDVDGLPYFVMPFVDGESLRGRLHRGPMLVPEAVRVLRDVARALAVAHARGVVHRDIKPDNVLLAGGAAVVADFGVAKAIASARRDHEPGAPHGAGVLTTMGTSLGTPAYMAPEQVAADPNVGYAADLYAVGVMAYEMLAGATPFHGRPPQATMAAHLAEAPADVRLARPGVPDALADLVMQCLEKSPEHRPASAAALVEALEDPAMVSGAFAPVGAGAPAPTPTSARTARPTPAGAAAPAPAPDAGAAPGRRRGLVAAVAATLVLGVAGAVATRAGGRDARIVSAPAAVAAAGVAGAGRTEAPDASGARPAAGAPDAGAAARGEAARPAAAAAAAGPSVVVLPFVYLGDDSTRAFMASAVTDAMTDALARVAGLRVASRATSRAVQQRLALGDTASLRVRTLVEGVVEQEGAAVRLSVRLVDAGDGFTLWADRFEGKAGSLFAMEDAVGAELQQRLREHFGLPAPGAAGGARRP
jgi:serine/threonine-protein kinase